MNISEIMQWRYSTKSFDTSKKIAPETLQQLKDALRWSPSSTNLQPWHFVLAASEEGKAQIAKSAAGLFQFNESKILNASHVVVLCGQAHTSNEHLQQVLDQEDADGRYDKPENKQYMGGARQMFLNIHRYTLKDETQWHAKQTYISMGSLLLAAAALGVDAVPIEGLDFAVLDQELGLQSKGYTALAVVALGYRAADDFNAKLPKSRLPEQQIITEI